MIKPVEIGLRVASLLVSAIVQAVALLLLALGASLLLIGEEVLVPFADSLGSIARQLDRKGGKR